MNEVVWTETALRGLRQIRAYLAQFNPRAAAEVAATLVAAGNSLSEFPQRGRPVAGTDMRELVTHYAYILRYRVAGDVVVVLRVRHAAQRQTTP